ncbi:ATPF1 factor, partial [Polypterus senegalus]
MRALAAPGTFLCRPRLQPGPSFMCDCGDNVMAVAVLQLHCLYRGLLAVRRPALSSVLPGAAWRGLRVFNVRKAPELEDNPFFAKYEEKIRQLRSAQPQEFQARLEKTVELKKEPVGQSRQGDFIQLMEQQASAEQLGSGASGPGGFTKIKTLASIINVDLIKEKTAEEIGEVGGVLGTMPVSPGEQSDAILLQWNDYKGLQTKVVPQPYLHFMKLLVPGRKCLRWTCPLGDSQRWHHKPTSDTAA